jgi:hypothetical protein
VREVLSPCAPLVSRIASIDSGEALLPIPPDAALQPEDHIVLTFDGLVQDGRFIDLMRATLQRLEEVYQGPVDIEYAVQIDAPTGQPERAYQLYILECRPLSAHRARPETSEREEMKENRRLFAMPTLLPSGTVEAIDNLVFVDPECYYAIEEEARRLEIAGIITTLNDRLPAGRFGLIGPGRWGSHNSRLSVPVSYSDICNARLLVEISPPYTPAPELAYGTDFFEDVLEAGIFVLGIQPTPQGGVMDWQLLRQSPNELSRYVPEAADWADCVRVIDLPAVAGSPLKIIIDDETNEAIACFDRS